MRVRKPGEKAGVAEYRVYSGLDQEPIYRGPSRGAALLVAVHSWREQSTRAGRPEIRIDVLSRGREGKALETEQWRPRRIFDAYEQWLARRTERRLRREHPGAAALAAGLARLESRYSPAGASVARLVAQLWIALHPYPEEPERTSFNGGDLTRWFRALIARIDRLMWTLRDEHAGIIAPPLSGPREIDMKLCRCGRAPAQEESDVDGAAHLFCAACGLVGHGRPGLFGDSSGR